MDNFRLDVTSEGRDSLAHALALAFTRHRKATHYRVVRLAEKTSYYFRECKEENAITTICDRFVTGHHRTESAVSDNGIETLILYWSETSKTTPLVYPLDYDKAVRFVADWLESADFGEQPDHDGSNGKGWRVFNEDWGHVLHEWQAFVAIQPMWAMYGK